jgi:hypothetical protein
MGRIFGLAKECIDMAPPEIERLLENARHEARVGAVSVMDWQARRRSTTAERRRELFDLYIRRHDLIDTWDLVDRSAIWVVGEYLVDRPRDVLYELAGAAEPMRRRRRSSAPMRSSVAATSTTRTGSPSCSSVTRTSSSRRRSAGCFARRASAMRPDSSPTSTRTGRSCPG